MRALLSLLCLAPILVVASPNFPEQIQHLSMNYQKLGEHRYYYKRIFRVYDAALYVEPSSEANDVLNANCSFKLTFTYLRPIEKQLAIDAASSALKKNLGPEEGAAIANRIHELNEAYLSVAKGDTTSLHYQPELGTSYYINGEKRAAIPGRDFAQLYFRIWLGTQPLSTDLRDDLLGLH